MSEKVVQLYDKDGNNIFPITSFEAMSGSEVLNNTFVKKSGDIMTGNLNVKGELTEKGARVYSPNNNPTRKVSITLPTSWTGSASLYTQSVTISGTTANSKVDLQPDATTIAQMMDDGTVALYIANDNGTLTAYAIGDKPTVALTIQATITEVSA